MSFCSDFKNMPQHVLIGGRLQSVICLPSPQKSRRPAHHMVPSSDGRLGRTTPAWRWHGSPSPLSRDSRLLLRTECTRRGPIPYIEVHARFCCKFFINGKRERKKEDLRLVSLNKTIFSSFYHDSS